MEWKSVLWIVSVFSHIVLITAQLRCGQQQQYSPTSCLEVRQDQPLSNQDSQSNCISSGLTGLVTFEEYGQFEALQSFAEVFLKDDELLWLGYYYDNNGDARVRESGELSESLAIDDAQNFVTGGVSPGDGVCIAIGRDGLLQRRMCSEVLSYACYQDWAPRITSFTIDGSRFLTNSDTRTLTCNYQALNSTVEWLRNNQILIDTSDSIISMSLGQSTLTVSMFEPQGGVMADLFECVVSNRVGGVISEAIGLVEAPSGTDMPVPTISSIDPTPQRSTIRTGSSVTLACNSNDTTASYSWFINGTRVDSATTSNYQINSFLGGFYQCRAALSTGENTVYTIRLDARDPPGPDESISATPLNRTSILISWFPPEFSRDPLLLRYTIFYTSDTTQNTIDLSTADSESNLLPVLRNGSVSRNGIVEYVLSGLDIGMEYFISVRASYMGLNGSNSQYIAVSSTYGHAPQDPVTNLMVFRTQNNKSLLAEWEKLDSKPQPPFGEVIFYLVEYRNSGKDIVMTARIAATFDFFSILELEDASAYEVRVRAGVQVSRDPPEYEFGEPTKWILAERIVENVPSPPPTLPVRTPSDGVIAAIVVVIVLVVSLVILVLVVGLIALCWKKGNGKDNGGDYKRERTESSIGLKERD